jgi:ATP-dependent Clp protease ATP-binding subunit ClpC
VVQSRLISVFKKIDSFLGGYAKIFGFEDLDKEYIQADVWTDGLAGDNDFRDDENLSDYCPINSNVYYFFDLYILTLALGFSSDCGRLSDILSNDSSEMVKENKILNEENNFVSCPSCQGSGKQGLGFDCSVCGGIGSGVFLNGYFFHWQPRIGFAMIELDRVRKQINLLFNLVAFVIGVIGLIALSAWVMMTASTLVSLSDFAFWSQRHWLLFIFWLSTVADFFVIYRMSREYLAEQAIKVFKYSANDQGALSELNNWEELKKAEHGQVIDVSKAMNAEAYAMVEEAYLLARKLRHAKVTPMHVFFVCLGTREASSIFSRLGADFDRLLEKLKEHLSTKELAKVETDLSLETKQLLIDSYLMASKWGQRKVSPKNLIYSALKYEQMLSEILYDMEIDHNKIRNVVLWFIINEKQVAAYRRFRSEARFKPASSMDRAYTSVATPILNNFAFDLTLAAKWNKLDFCVSRDDEIGEIWNILESGANGVLLYGPDGAGKKALIAGIAQHMVEEDVPAFLIDKRLLELDVARLVSGVSPSQAEGRMMMILDEVNRAGNIILFLSDIENIMGISSGTGSSLDLSEVLNSAIDRRLLFVFASVNSENYLKYVEGSPLDRSMAKVEISEPKGDQAIQIIESKIAGIEGRYNVYFSYNSIEQSVVLSNKYMHDSYLPEKAIKILELAAVRSSKTKKDFPIILAEDVAKIVSEITSIPLTKLSEQEGKELINLEEKMHERMISQHEAVKMVSASLRRARTELREGVRPIANFLFLGPTGVGKTELAKTVADVYFGSEKYLLRIDMSEYQAADSIRKMIGDPDGTKGYLTELVRKTPFSLVLLDEIEKAHPDILNLFLQVMDDGRLTDGQGRLIDFTNTIIIATSNAGANYIQEEVYKGTPIAAIAEVLINKELSKVMRPELINRFDGVIVFEPLSLNNVVDISRLMLRKVEKLLEAKGIELRTEESGLRVLAKLGFDPKFGARPLRRVIQDRIEDQIANKILSGELKRRDTVVIDEEAMVRVEKGIKI